MLTNRSYYTPTDAPSSPEGFGSFKPPGPTGSQSSNQVPSRSSPVGRQGASAQSSASGSTPQSVLFSTLSNLYIGDNGFEGEIDYLYADIYGYVTIGVGHLVVANKSSKESDVRAALKNIPLVHKSNIICTGSQHENCKYKAYCEVCGRYATWSAHSADKTYLSSHSSQLNKQHNLRTLSADKYIQNDMPGYSDVPTNADLVITKDAVLTLLTGDLSAKYIYGIHFFSNLSTLPFSVQLVIVDILFNGVAIGNDKAERQKKNKVWVGWQAFQNAIHKRDWAEAANHCAAGIDPNRDAWRRNQLLIAVTTQ